MTPISIAVTTYNRYEWTIRAFEQILDDDRVSEVVISDDKSTDGSYEKLCEFFKGSPKVKVFQNDFNVNMSLNKKLAIERCSSEMVLIIDSDNIFGKDFLDAMFKMQPFEKNTIYNSAWAKDRFDFRKHQGKPITQHNVAQFMDDPMFRCACNVCNYLVHRDSYLRTYRYNPDIKGADTIHHLFYWLIDDKQFFIVPNATYEHTNGSHSHFMEHVDINMRHAIELENKLRQLK